MLKTEALGYWYQQEVDYLFKDVDLSFEAGKMTFLLFFKHIIYCLIHYSSPLENVLTAMSISGVKIADQKAEVLQQLAAVGIDENLAKEKVSELSGGQQQRVAIVRALCCDHQLIIADEPTGNLDEKTSQEIVQLFQEIAHQQQKCIIIVTHEKEVATACDQIYELKHRTFHEQING